MGGEGDASMGAATAIPQMLPSRFRGTETADVTLLELVNAICEVTDDDREVVATVLHMLRTRQVRLCGNFSGAIEDLS